jgi:hypothetical protein
MSKNKKNTITDVLFSLLILWAILHYFASGYMAPLSYQECRDKNIANNQVFCDCAKTKLRLSPYFESFIIGAATDNDKISRKIAQGVYNIKRVCKK